MAVEDRVRLRITFPIGLSLTVLAVVLAAPGVSFSQSNNFEVKVLGSVDDTIAYWKARSFWGEETRDDTLLSSSRQIDPGSRKLTERR